VEHGEAVVITRDGVPVGRFVPERHSTAERLKAALREHPVHSAFADDVEAARADLRAAFADEMHTWPDA
jgi:antitoxin (DNA-binding transcriptional repressor) of toxin-antitoxin stability system